MTELNDSSKISTVQVHLVLLDVNDNSPTFSSSVYSGNVSELADLGTPVLSVTAEDPDHVRVLCSI